MSAGGWRLDGVMEKDLGDEQAEVGKLAGGKVLKFNR